MHGRMDENETHTRVPFSHPPPTRPAVPLVTARAGQAAQMGGAGAAVTSRVGAFAAGGTACDSTSASSRSACARAPAPSSLVPLMRTQSP